MREAAAACKWEGVVASKDQHMKWLEQREAIVRDSMRTPILKR
jgi:hypothetical protein